MSRSAPSTPQKPKNIPLDKLKSPGGRRTKPKDITPIDLTIKTALFEEKSPAKSFKSKISVDAGAITAYKVLTKANSNLGGNGSTGAIYGEITVGSMQRIIDYMVAEMELSSQSLFIDVGAGLGKPNLHVAQCPGVRLSIGIELEKIRWQMSMSCLKAILKHKAVDGNKQLKGHTHLMAGDIEIASSTDPFTHIYQYDLGFPPPLQQSIARKFNSSQHAKYLVSYRPPHRVIEEYGYEVSFVDSMHTSMTGSGEGHTAYFYKRTNKPPALTAAVKKTLKSLTLDARPANPEDPADRTVWCDPAFHETCRLAAALDNSELVAFVTQAEHDYLHGASEKRERKPRIIADAI